MEPMREMLDSVMCLHMGPRRFRGTTVTDMLHYRMALKRDFNGD
jgi:hypothetical protein